MVYPTAPANVVATSNNSVVSVSWPAATGASSYKVERSPSRTGAFQVVATTSSLAITDVVPGSATPVTYVYRVRSVDSASTWSRDVASPLDFATTATTLFAQSIGVASDMNGSHMTELQKAADALRIASGLSAVFGSAPSLVQAPIAASDYTAVITALNAARGAWGLPAFTYTGVPPPSVHGDVYAAHMTQLREAVELTA